MWCSVGEFSCFWHIFFHCLNAQVLTRSLPWLYTFTLFTLFLALCYFVDFIWCLSAVNIKGVFNSSNETKYEKDPPDGTFFLNIILAYFNVNLFLVLIYCLQVSLWVNNTPINFPVFPGISIDFNFYKTFWSLQVTFPHLEAWLATPMYIAVVLFREVFVASKYKIIP